jgi:hypothetical protein
MKRVLVVSVTLSLTACNPAADTKAAEQSVVSFHQQLDAGQFDQIYASTTPEFKAASTRDDFTKLLAAVHRKLGNFRSGQTGNWNDNATTGGHFLTLERSAQFERGPAQEEFVFKVDGKSAVLVGYHIASNTLITT